jgi:hypothetical protein
MVVTVVGEEVVVAVLTVLPAKKHVRVMAWAHPHLDQAQDRR